MFCIKALLIHLLPSPAAVDQPAGDGEDEGGAGEEEMLLGTRGAKGKGSEEFSNIVLVLF